ncbi:pteridine-dependent deoxygenase [Sinimarinibacterium sp. CAU 1509]|uniref:chorismate transformation enzyme, FkbO/Hyg5 family n=1 Tax=Sinimarinibacterium sp. CAU 1509 TaxID=2562283 RepID=UPI0010AB620B|nr:pteridine-dependent deoxygenase [Sinimarinibacterium sp. CAU 1509]TJY58296.1 pteridine-dependent deoxygenase [Sinimarinibacterium sp. CAU 1509]
MQQHTEHRAQDSSARADIGLPPRPYGLRVVEHLPESLGDDVLFCVSHGPAPTGTDPRYVQVQLDALRGPAVELWTSPTPVRHGVDQNIRFAENGQVLFGQIHLNEAQLADIDREVFHTYALLDGFLQRHGYPAWLRVWNFMAQIHAQAREGDADQERYRQFVLGRYKALALKPGFERELPAATAIGTHGDGLTIYFLAARTPGTQIENPRQVSAFHYPREYGPKSPSFSRAMYLPWADGPELLVSGTASVVGHRTLHTGHPARQLDETLANIDSLLQQATAPQGLADARLWQPQQIKLYLRDPQLLDAVWPQIERAFPPAVAVTALHGDVCRSDLSLEIEALYRYTGARA